MTIKMQVLSAIQRINGKGLNVYRWHESNYKEDIYKPTVLAADHIEKQKQLRKYQIDQLGYISLCDGKTENVGEYDILMNQKGNEIKIYDTSILPELEKIKKVSIYKYNQSKKALSFSIKKAKSQDDLFKIFKFASDNSLVEWSIARTHNLFALGTYHNPIVSPGYSGVGFDIKNIISEVHSHPNIKANDFDELDSAGGDKGRYYNLSNPFLYYIYFPESRNLKNLYPDKHAHTVGFRQIRKITSHKDFYFGTLNSK